MTKVNVEKLIQELKASGITTHGNCSSTGIVWDDDNSEIQDRPDVVAVLQAHDPTPDAPAKTTEQEIVELKAQVARQNELLVSKNLITVAEVAAIDNVLIIDK